MRPVIHSEKHYVQFSIATVTASAATSFPIIESVAVDAKNTVSEVVEGAVIKAVYVEFWIRSAEADVGASGQAVLVKLGGDQATLTTVEMAALGDYTNKKNILYTTMGLYNDDQGNATAIIRGWVKIPKSKQRFGLGDSLELRVFAGGAIDLHVCGFATYKEYT